MNNSLLQIIRIMIFFLTILMPYVVKSQTAPLMYQSKDYQLTSNKYNGTYLSKPSLVESHTIFIENASWLQIHFNDVNLGKQSYIEITSVADGGTQRLTADDLLQWNRSSAYFNGSEIELSLFVAPGDVGIHFSIDKLYVGDKRSTKKNFAIESQCGAVDDRIPSNDPAVGRIFPVGCTGWIITSGKLITAGHCIDDPTLTSILEFNVPPTLADGTLQHPPPEDQYPINTSSFMFSDGGVGNDWGVFEVFNNTTTNLQPIAAQASSFTLVQDLTPPTIRITGYGVDSDVTASQTQQTHTGPNAGSSGTTLRYQVDTEGGNSGSPVIDETNGVAIGVHSHGGCLTSGTGSNAGTSTFNTAFWSAANSSVSSPDLIVQFPNVSVSTLVAGQNFTVSATVKNQGTANADATTLRYFISDDSTITATDTELATDAIPALSANGTSFQDEVVATPAAMGTFWIGACVDSVGGESDATNNCSIGIEVAVVDQFEPDNSSTQASVITTGVPQNHSIVPANDEDWVTFSLINPADITLTTSGPSGDTRMWLYDSNLNEIEFDDDDGVNLFSVINQTGLSTGTYYVKVDEFGNDNEITDYTLSFVIDFMASPDLVVQPPSVSSSVLNPDENLIITAIIENQGSSDAADSTLRYYLSTDSTITVSDTQLATDPVPVLAPSATSEQSADISAPSIPGTYWVGACVDTVSGELNLTNNCSQAVQIEVSESGILISPIAKKDRRINELKDEDEQWYSFNSTESQKLSVQTNGFKGDTLLELYTGDIISTAVLLKADDNSGPEMFSNIKHTVSSGPHLIRLKGNTAVNPYFLRLMSDKDILSFNDTTSHFANKEIRVMSSAGITGGCGVNQYCPTDPVTRAQMAIFMLKAILGGNHNSPAATGTVFNDVSTSSFGANFIEEFSTLGITSGCGGGKYCPDLAVTREQMAVFLLRAWYGSSYTPPAATPAEINQFSDIANSFAKDWIVQLTKENITGGCGGGKYCPTDTVTRGQMAAFIARTFDLDVEL